MCRYYAILLGPGALGTTGPEAPSLVEGTQYWKRCTDTRTGATTSIELILGPAAVDPAQMARDLAEEAYARLVVPIAVGRVEPTERPGGDQRAGLAVGLRLGSTRSESA